MGNDQALKLISLLGSNTQIINIIKENNYDIKVCVKAIPFLKLRGKNEGQILCILRKTGYEPSICIAALDFIKKEKNVMRVIKRSAYVPEVCQAAISGLNLGSKSEGEIMSILRQVKFDLSICESSLNYLIKERNILKVLKRHNYNKRLVDLAVKRLQILKCRP
ncbi:MAG: hypothetical protein PHX76_03360 [Patescibacteria group bacterium]|nr:hypothetical protein [Patescibacteria group bacterium]